MDCWINGICTVNGINIHYLRTGGNKPPVVLLHGLMASGNCWTNVASELEQDFDVIMPDCRGHGDSSATEEGYTYDILAFDILCFMDELGLVKPVLVGHSMGGMIATVLACQNLKTLRGLVLVDPTFLTLEQQKEVYESDIMAQHCRILEGSKEDYLTGMQARNRLRSNELIKRLTEARFKTCIHAFKILIPPNPDYIQLISNIELPCILVVGDAGVVTLETAQGILRINQCIKMIQITETGHGIPFDQPGNLSIAIKEFLLSLTN